MVTPFSKFQKIEDIEPLMDKEERLLYPLVDNTIMMLNKSEFCSCLYYQ